mmetsp:Transcript_11598/g.40354  ORF Transcript_11598/g.40354 Transcript_11598/m.40354 type:complete len:116 (-) Transcript_11598:2917-3264(-)
MPHVYCQPNSALRHTQMESKIFEREFISNLQNAQFQPVWEPLCSFNVHAQANLVQLAKIIISCSCIPRIRSMHGLNAQTHGAFTQAAMPRRHFPVSNFTAIFTRSATFSMLHVGF